MGRISNQIRQLDVAGWGIAAMICGALAVLSANLAAFVPPNLLAGLHATRIQGGSFNQLRSQLAEVAEETLQMNREYATLLTRFNLLDDNSGDAIRRLAAVENSLPLLIEALPLDSDIDRGLLTASISSGEDELTDVDGGEMRVQQTELFPGNPDDANGPQAPPSDQPMPPEVTEAQLADAETVATSTDIPGTLPQGIAIGQPHPLDTIETAWQEILVAVGPLVLGLEPRVAANDETGSQIVAGPLPDLSAAETLCDRIERAGLTCVPAPFDGASLPPR
ncbi:hypothetical protein [Pelagibacterium halotolerans]|uniref:hypothetical protein n=1 Tax=Pelagibacterium halotolerans TaxID=531813 RepID=UPI00384B07EC